MNILFVYSKDIWSPKYPLQTPMEMQFGISYISSFLKKHGHNTKLIVLSKLLGKQNETRINEYLRKFYPDIMCFTIVATEFKFIISIADYIKRKYPNIYLVAGGPHVSLNPEEVIKHSFDALCVGEGEFPVSELVANIGQGETRFSIFNMWIKHNSDVVKNPTRPFLQDIDSLPFPDRKMWIEWIDPDNKDFQYPILLGRGCPHLCTYCSNHALRKIASDKYVRMRSVDNVMQEINEVISTFPKVREIYFEVETIGVNRKWAFELCYNLEKLNSHLKKPLSFGVNLRITQNADYSELFAVFKRSNFRFINIGLESGSERIRREVLKRNYSNEDVIRTVQQAKKYGIEVSFFNLIGIPGETFNDFMETVEMNRKCQPNRHMTSIFYPYPGTELYSFCKAQGLIGESFFDEVERTKAVLNLPGFSEKEIQRCFTMFDYYIYKGHKPLYVLLIKLLISKMKSYYYFSYLLKSVASISFLKRLKVTVQTYFLRNVPS